MVNAPGTTYTGTVDGTHPYNSISLPFPNGISPPPGRSLGTSGTQQFLTQVVQSITEVNRFHHPEAYVQQWNLNVERQLPAGFLLSAAYVGSKGTHLEQYSQQTNQISDALLSQAAQQFAAGGTSAVTLLQSVPNPFFVNGQALALGAPTTTVGQLLRPYPQYTSVELAGQGSFASIYHSLQITAQRRFAGAGSLLVAYTNSKLISNTDTLTSWLETGVGSLQDNNNLRNERSFSSQDVPQRLVISYVLDLPFGQGKKYLSNISGKLNSVVDGWGIDGVTTFQRGFPLVFSNGQANDATLFGAGSRPNRVPGCDNVGVPSAIDGSTPRALSRSCGFHLRQRAARRFNVALGRRESTSILLCSRRSYSAPRVEWGSSPGWSFSTCSIARNLLHPTPPVAPTITQISDL